MFIEIVYKNGTVLNQNVYWATVNLEEQTVSYVEDTNPHPIANIVTIPLENIKHVHIENDGAI